jgi:hypothetical protein
MLAAAAVVVASTAAVTMGPTSASTAVTPSAAYSVALPTGDRVIVHDAGRRVEFRAGAGREAVSHRTLTLAGRTYVIPADAQLLVASGAVDLGLFEVRRSAAATAWSNLTEPDPAVGGLGLGSRRLRPGVRRTGPAQPIATVGTTGDAGITVRYVDRAGRPTATAYSILRNVDDPTVFAFVVPEPDGTARVSVPSGRYLLESTVDTPRSGRPDPAVAVTVAPLLSVERSTDLVVDARAARPVSVTVPDPAAVGVGALAAFRRTVNGGTVRSVYGSPDVTALFTAHDGPAVPPADFDAAVSVLFARPGPSGTTRDSPLVYATGWHRDGAFFTGFRHRVVESDLSTVHTHHETVAPGRAAVRSIGVALSSGAAAQSMDVDALPFDRVERYAGTARWSNVLTEYAAGTDFADAVTQEQPSTAYAPGRTYTERWNATPYWPAPHVTRDGATLFARFAMYSDASGDREGTGSTSRARVDLHRDGTPVGTADHLDGAVFPLTAGPARYRLTATAERTWTAIFSRTTVTWTFTTAPSAAPETLPLMSVRFVPVGPRTLRVHLMRAATLTVDASFDGGRTWQPTTLTGTGDTRTATLPRAAAGGTPVSLRARAEASDGATVDQTTINAYRA